MAQLGRNKVSFIIKGTNRADPLPMILREYMSLAKRRETLYKILNRSAQPMAADMRAGAPVRTGALSKSFRVRKAKRVKKFTEVSVFVGGVNGNYVSDGQAKKMVGWRAHWAELGTVKHPGNFFLQPAIRKGIPVAQARIRKSMAILLRKMRQKHLGKG